MAESAKSSVLRVTFDQDGTAVEAVNTDGTPVKYGPDEKLTLVGAKLASHYREEDLAALPDAVPEQRDSQGIVVEFAEDGTAVTVRNQDGTSVEYASGQEVTIPDAHIRSYDSATAEYCCWRMIGGVWYCHPSFCG